MGIGATTNSTDTSRVLNAQLVSKTMRGMASGKSSQGASVAALSSALESLIGSSDSADSNLMDAVSALQTSGGYMDAVSRDLDMMKKISVEANSGTLSSADKQSLDAQFKTLQDDITTITSNYNALAKFNGSPLLQGDSYRIQAGSTQSQTIVVDTPDMSSSNDQSVGTVDTYSYNSENKLIGSLHTETTWSSMLNSVGALKPDDPNSVGALDKAIDFVSSAKASNSTDVKKMISNSASLQTYESNLNSAYSLNSDLDMASASSTLATGLVMTQAQAAIQAQANLQDMALKLALIKR